MKKTLLFILLFSVLISFSQINSQITPLIVCDDNNDGIAIFDLTSKTDEILDNLNPAIHFVSFHETQDDANFGANAINAATNYTGQNFQIIFVQVVNTQTSVISFTTFELKALQGPPANPATLTFCGSGSPIYNLHDATNQIVNSQIATIVEYYLTISDAQANTNSILNPTSFFTQANPQVLFARAFFPFSDCFSITTLTLNVCDQVPLAPTNLIVSNINENGVTISWTDNNPGNNTYQAIYTINGGPLLTIFPITNSLSLPSAPNVCYTFQVNSTNQLGVTSPWSETLSFCTNNCTNNASCSESLELIAFLDLNNNSIKDANESNFNYGNFEYQINSSGTPLYGNTNNGSFLLFENNPTNTYNLSFALDSNFTTYYNSSTTFSNITVPTGSGSNIYYFPITQLQPYNDLEILLVPMGVPRPGFTHNNLLYYKNKGDQTVSSGTVTFTKGTNVSIISNSQSGAISNPTGFSYAFTNLFPNEQRFIQIGLLVPTIPTVSLGDIVTNSAAIEPSLGDATPTDNATALSQIIVGSYDPNDKAESHGGKVLFSNFTSNDYLTYTIQFENTGTANAEFIRVEDFLNASLDKNSIVMLNASHSYDMKRINNKLIWNFYNINLPPTITNPTQSHGFIQFKIKPSTGFNVGTIIPNSAEIYFDYNPPIYTNTFNTEFTATLNNLDFNSGNFLIYPNPATDVVQVNLSTNSGNIRNIVIFDVLGKIVKKVAAVNSNQANINVSELSAGIYIVEVATENNVKQIKKLIIQ